MKCETDFKLTGHLVLIVPV